MDTNNFVASNKEFGPMEVARVSFYDDDASFDTDVKSADAEYSYEFDDFDKDLELSLPFLNKYSYLLTGGESGKLLTASMAIKKSAKYDHFVEAEGRCVYVRREGMGRRGTHNNPFFSLPPCEPLVQLLVF